MSRSTPRVLASQLISATALIADLASWNGSGGLDTLARGVVIGAGLVLAHLPAIVRPEALRLAAVSLWTYGMLVAVLDGSFAPFAGLCVVLARFVAQVRTRDAVIALIVVAVPFGFNATNTSDEATGAANPFLVSATIWVVLALVPYGVGRVSYHATRRTKEREMAKAEESKEELRLERLRLARELHDIISHSVSAMILQAAGARASSAEGDPRQRAALGAIENTGVQAMRELHRLLGLLRSTEGDGPAEMTLAEESIADLDPLLESVRACDVEVDLVDDGGRRELDPSVDHAAYRTVQEALANVIKHAGRGAAARVQLHWRPDLLKIDVRNTAGLLDGGPRPDLSSGSGLVGLAERIALVGGRFESGPTADGAFLVRAELPLTAADLQPGV